jgi:hypothetical protein
MTTNSPTEILEKTETKANVNAVQNVPVTAGCCGGIPHGFTDRERAVLLSLSAEQELSPQKVLLQGLRLYQLAHDCSRRGYPVIRFFSHDGREMPNSGPVGLSVPD